MNYVNGISHDAADAMIASAVPEAPARHPVTPDLVRKLYAPLPAEALQPHPSKAYLSTIKTIFVIDRLNEVFGIGGWTYKTEVVEAKEMVVMKVTLTVPAYGVSLEQYGGSDNEDRGDSYKGAVTDALSKIGGYLGIAMDVYKGGGPTKSNPRGKAMPQPAVAAQPKPVPVPAAPQPAAQLPAKPAPAPVHPPSFIEDQPDWPADPTDPWVKVRGVLFRLGRDGKYQRFTALPAAPAATLAAASALPMKAGEIRKSFNAVRELIGEVRYMEELMLATVRDPLEFRDRNKAQECFNRMWKLAQEEK